MIIVLRHGFICPVFGLDLKKDVLVCVKNRAGNWRLLANFMAGSLSLTVQLLGLKWYCSYVE